MSTDAFKAAADRVKTLSSRPDNAQLLELYALFKQGSEGDVSGARPGALNFKERAKYDAWATKKGLSPGDAQAKYVALVDGLVARQG